MKKRLKFLWIVLILCLFTNNVYAINIKGDMDKNGSINLSDVIYILKGYLGTVNFTNEDIQNGDMNGDGKIDLRDIIMVLRKYLGLNESNDLSTVYFTDLPKANSPTKLLVLLFNYNNGQYDMPDDEIEKAWSDYIFGTGSMETETASVNDYFKEISKNEFYFEPIYIGDNTTGVYSFHLDKDYSDDQYYKDNYFAFDFKHDIADAMGELQKRGLDISPFVASREISEYDHQFDIPVIPWDGSQSERNNKWFETYKIMAVFPTYNKENVSHTPISADRKYLSLYAHINYNSSFGTIVHELLHTLGTIDIYNFGSYGSDIMSSVYPLINAEYNTMHVDPFYKIIFGWADAEIINSSGLVTLHSQSSDKYNPIIIKTPDSGQYYILENRYDTGFDWGISYKSCTGINVWRIDKLGMEAIYNRNRKGMQLVDVLKYNNQSLVPNYYSDFDNIDVLDEVSSNIHITYVSKNSDGSITINIEQ